MNANDSSPTTPSGAALPPAADSPVSWPKGFSLSDLTWEPDELGPDFERTTIDLGVDPEGETDIVSTLVRHSPTAALPDNAPTVLWIHGMTDYFFQSHVAEHLAQRGIRTMGIDLRKCGRSWRPGQRWHHTLDLAHYDTELNVALAAAGATGPVVVLAHSTGGLIAPLWLDRLRIQAAYGDRAAQQLLAPLRGVVLNSPWLGMMVPNWAEKMLRPAVRTLGKARPNLPMPADGLTAYGESIHSDYHGEWNFNTNFKPITGQPKTFGWLRAIVVGQDTIHSGVVECPAPTVVLCSTSSWLNKPYSAATDCADAVLDVEDIVNWAPSLVGDEHAVRVQQIPGARHDVFLSQPIARQAAFVALDEFLDEVGF